MVNKTAIFCMILLACIVCAGACIVTAFPFGKASPPGPSRYVEATIKPLSAFSWSALTVPCPENESWCPSSDPPFTRYRILVDLGHAERVTLDGVISPNLDRSFNTRLFDWQDWAKDMRSQGYEVRVTTQRPITAALLADTDLYIVAQPDMSQNGPVFFTADEKDVISCFVLRGNTLLVMAQQFMGGPDRTQYNADLANGYLSSSVINDLLQGIHVSGRFSIGNTTAGTLDLINSNTATSQVFIANPPDIWLPADNLKPEMKYDTFAGFHVLSIQPKTVQYLVRGDATTYTSAKNKKYAPAVQAVGSRPIAIGVNQLGCGRVYLYGDPSAWQKQSYIGKVYTEPKYHEQEAARVLVQRMLAYNLTCEPCRYQAQQTQAQVTTKTPTIRLTPLRPFSTPTPTVTRFLNRTPTRTITRTPTPTVTPFGDCASCIGDCNSLPELDRMTCYSGCTGPFSPEAGGFKCVYCLEQARASGLGGDAFYDYYSQCLIDHGCDCPVDCDSCLSNCGSDEECQAGCRDEGGSPCITTSSQEDCKTCIVNCGTDMECQAACRDEGGLPCLMPQEDCKTCIVNCGTDTACQAACRDDAGLPCLAAEVDCKTCLSTCGSDGECRARCRDAEGEPCVPTQTTEDCPKGFTTCFERIDGSWDCSAAEKSVAYACPGEQNMICSTGENDLCTTYCSCVGTTTPTPTPTPTPTAQAALVTSACADCYRSCKSANSGTGKDAEMVANTCVKNCDTQYKTNILSCACANSEPCGTGEYRVVSKDLKCSCLPVADLTFEHDDLSGQWTAHISGSQQQSSGQNCQRVTKTCHSPTGKPYDCSYVICT